MINKILQKVTAFTQMRYMKILMNGFMGMAAVTIAGSLFNLVKSIPIGPWQTFLAGSGLGAMLSVPISITSNMMAIYVLISMAYFTAKSFEKDGFAASLIAIGSFMILTPLTASNVKLDPATGERIVTTVTDAVPLSAIGSQGIFLAVIVGILAARLYIFFLDRGFKIRMPESVPPNVSSMFENMIPGGIVFVVFLFVRWGIGLTSYGTAQNLIYTVLQTPIMHIGGGLAGVIVSQFLVKLFWLFGIHGGMIVNSAIRPIMSAANSANLAAFAEGAAAPFPEWTYAVVICSGVGVLALNILLLTAKSKQYKTLAKIALPTSLFNITEPMVFGMPLIMNPILAVPFVVSPVISIWLTWLVTNIGLVAMPTGVGGQMFLPIPISMSLLNAHWTGFVWGCVLIIINIVLFFPFFKVADKRACEMEEQENTLNVQTDESGV